MCIIVNSTNSKGTQNKILYFSNICANSTYVKLWKEVSKAFLNVKLDYFE